MVINNILNVFLKILRGQFLKFNWRVCVVAGWVSWPKAAWGMKIIRRWRRVIHKPYYGLLFVEAQIFSCQRHSWSSGDGVSPTTFPASLGMNVAIVKHHATSICLHSASNTPLMTIFFCSNLLIFLFNHGLKCTSSLCLQNKIQMSYPSFYLTLQNTNLP